MRVGEYELEAQIGAGASGTVWRARRLRPVTHTVALKRLRAGGSPDDMAQLRREAGVLVELDHPHVVRILDVIDDEGGVALAMMLAAGGSLADLLAERGRLTSGQVVAVAAPIADALASAHRRGIVHGDVKPANVLFTTDGDPLLSDFGVARSLGARPGGHLAGTAAYLAPELLADGLAPGPTSDIYALGVVCYQMLAGELPYRGSDPGPAAADQGRHRPLQEVEGVPLPLAHAVETAMARNPDARFRTAVSLAGALRGAVPFAEVVLPGPAAHPAAAAGGDGSDGLTRDFGPRPPRPAPPPPPRPRRRRRLGPALAGRRLQLLVGIGLMSTALLLVLVLRGGDDSADPKPPGPPHPSDCPTLTRPQSPASGQVVKGDPEGDGCPTYGVYLLVADQGVQRMILSIDVGGKTKRIGLGSPGDQVVLGDWNCDKTDTPALYRTSSGVVDYYDVWPIQRGKQYRPSAHGTAQPGGIATLRPGQGNTCDRVAVRPRPAPPQDGSGGGGA